MGIRTIANVGAEESPQGRVPAAAQSVARLWSLLFPRDARSLSDGTTCDGSELDARLGSADAAAFRWIEDDAAHAWLNTEDARKLAEDAGLPLAGASPEVVRRVHDKAFAHAVAEEAGLLPSALRGLVTPFTPEELGSGESAVRTIRAHVESWPDWTRGRFTLKPRMGSSGRGRVPGEAASFDDSAIARALPRLAERGGALLEPWLERESDLSAQLHIARDGIVTLLGTLELRVSDSGVYRGHRGWLDHRLRIASGSRHDDGLLEAAMILARAAHAQGYHGPCGVDAFAFFGPDGVVLRPAVEFNARFTMGTIVAGLLRRARAMLRHSYPTQPGRRRALCFALDPGPETSSEAAWQLPLGEGDARLEVGVEIGE